MVIPMFFWVFNPLRELQLVGNNTQILDEKNIVCLNQLDQNGSQKVIVSNYASKRSEDIHWWLDHTVPKLILLKQYFKGALMFDSQIRPTSAIKATEDFLPRHNWMNKMNKEHKS